MDEPGDEEMLHYEKVEALAFLSDLCGLAEDDRKAGLPLSGWFAAAQDQYARCKRMGCTPDEMKVMTDLMSKV